MGQDDGIVKKNPLMNLGRQFHEAKSFPSDSSNVSDSEDFADSSARSDDHNLYNVRSHFHRNSFCNDKIHCVVE